MVMDISCLGVAAARRRLAAGELSAEALMQACLDRIEARDAEVGAWQYVDRERALALARECDRTAPLGPLHGIPVGLKDIIDTVDQPTEYGSPIHAGHRALEDAECVLALRRAGAVVLGKTVTTEFAAFAPGRTANPRNPAHTPGGSSSGSAAAVADCQVPVALGTQTAGSVIRPASFTGVVGYKPSYGDFSCRGVHPLAASLDTLGVFARECADLPLMRAALATRTPGLTQVRTSAPRFGLVRTSAWDAAEAAMQCTVLASATRLAGAGASVVEVELPFSFDELVTAQKVIMAVEATISLAYELRVAPERISTQMRDLLAQGQSLSREAYQRACASAARARAAVAEFFETYDALLVASAPGEAPYGLAATGDPLFNRVFTLLHLPCVGLPAGTGALGLPLGVQLVGAFARDDDLIATACWAEAQLGRDSCNSPGNTN